MNLAYIPLLRQQRELQGMPRGMERFNAYLTTMIGEGDDIVAPLVMMNPMGKQHVTALLDELLVLGVESAAEQAALDVAARFEGEPGSYRISVVVVDDAQGGWTERYSSEMAFRFRKPPPGSSRWQKQPWIAVPLWTGDAHTADSVQRETRAALGRTIFTTRHGTPSTLRAMLGQEGLVYAFAGLSGPWLDAEELAYSIQVIAPYLDVSEYPTIFSCIWGDEAAAALGYTSLGLPPWAGLAVAADAARRFLALNNLSAEQALELEPARIF